MPPVRETLRNAKKKPHVFSGIAIDQAREQNNASVTGDGGAVGLTENPAALRCWMVSGPEMARLIGEFEVSTKKIQNRFPASPADETCTDNIRTRYHVIN